MPTFRTFLADASPTWLKKIDGYGVRMMQGMVGYFGDLIAESFNQAIKAAWLKQSTRPQDALDPIGDNFNIERVPGELDADYETRLNDAWTLWEEAATLEFAENAFTPFGIDASDILLRTRNEWTFAANRWSQFWVVLTDDAGSLPWAEDIWGPGVWGDEGTWGTDATFEEITGIVKLVCKWKSAHELPVETILLYGDGAVWGVGTWGVPRVWGTDQVVRWPMARLWGEGYPFRTWGDVEPYTGDPAVWGGKIRFT